MQLTIAEWVGKKNATKEILSLVGQLQHACKVVRYGRTFVARMYCTASKVKELDFYIYKAQQSLQVKPLLVAYISEELSACLNWQTKIHQLTSQYKLTRQGHGAVVPSLIINGFNGNGQKSGNQ